MKNNNLIKLDESKWLRGTGNPNAIKVDPNDNRFIRTTKKFRGQRIDDNSHKWIYGFFTYDIYGRYFIHADYIAEEHRVIKRFEIEMMRKDWDSGEFQKTHTDEQNDAFEDLLVWCEEVIDGVTK